MQTHQMSSQHEMASGSGAKGGAADFSATWVTKVASSLALAALLWAALWLVLPDATPRVHAQTPSATQAPNQATVIVQFDNQARVVRNVEFTTPISGLVALQWSGLSVVYTETAFGPAVCSIEGVGCPKENCFCHSDYWGYNYWDGTTWQGYATGPGGSVISQTGGIEGWRWGTFGDASVGVSHTLASQRALDWIHARQVVTDGGYGSAGAAVEILLATGANGVAAEVWRPSAGAPSLASYVKLNGAMYTKAAAGAAGKTAVALSATDLCLPTGALTAQDFYSPTLGAYTEQSGPNSWAILGAVAVNESVPVTAVNGLRAAALADGAWEWAPDWGSDTNSTALAIQALIAAGDSVSSTAVVNGLAYLASAQNTDGGFGYSAEPDAESDTNSTAYVVQAIVAAGQDPNGPTWTISNSTPISYLLSLQLPDGSFEWQPGTGANLLATVQVIPALLGRANPITLRELVACPAVRLPKISGNQE